MSKLDELKEKFESVIESLKSKLKRGGKSDDDEEEEDEDVDPEESTSEVDIEDITAQASKKVREDAVEDEEDDDDKTDPKKVAPTDKEKKKQLMIRAGLGIVILYLAVDQLFLSETVDEVPEVQEIKPKKPRRKRKPKADPTQAAGTEAGAVATPESTAVETPAAVPTETVAEKPVDIPPETSAEVLKPDETPTPSVEETPPAEVTTTQPEIVEPPSMTEETPIMPVTETAVVEPTPEATPETTPEVEAAPEATPEIEAAMGQQDDMSKEIDTLVDTVEEKKKDPVDKMKQMLGAKTDYIAPPSFERSGRGLVYNCAGKHWACVDKLSYFQCRGNEVWSLQNKKNPDCSIKNVYATDRDCEAIQAYYVKFNEPTGFCQDATPTKTQVEETDLNM